MFVVLCWSQWSVLLDRFCGAFEDCTLLSGTPIRPSVCVYAAHSLFFQSGIRSTHLSQVVKCVSHLSGIPNS